jgi:hypothetical protein
VSAEPSAYEGAGERRPSASEVVAGYLAALAIFTSVIGLAWHPLRLTPLAMLLALIGAGMGGKGRRLTLAAVMIAAACFFLGLTVSVLTERPLW